jgi:hypothetical protein
MAKGQRDSNREAFWRGVLAKFSTSGLNIRDFCRQAKITEASFYAWRRTIQQRDAEQARQHVARTGRARPAERRQPPTFVPLVVRDEQPTSTQGSAITIKLGTGPRSRVLRLPLGIAADRLAELIRAVESVNGPADSTLAAVGSNS